MRLERPDIQARIANLCAWPLKRFIGSRVRLDQIDLCLAQRGFIIHAHIAYDIGDGQYRSVTVEGDGVTPLGALWDARQALARWRATEATG